MAPIDDESVPFIKDDDWLKGQSVSRDVAELKDNTLAIDATYFLGHLLNNPPAHEPLLVALGGLTGIEIHLNTALDMFQEHSITPFFVFDGQDMVGQDDVFTRRARAANKKTDEAWSLYSRSRAEQAVATFGSNPSAYRLQNLYPLLQMILHERGLGFLVAPYSACAQMAYLEKVDSDMCGGVMGPEELLLYPIHDCVIRSFDWAAGTVTAIHKSRVLSNLGVNETMFTDAMLMTGTSFLPKFPPLRDQGLYQHGSTIFDAYAILRTAEKNMATACASFNDLIQAHDPTWLDKYRKARMAIHHFIYISERGTVEVNAPERLTADNHEYLGLKMPEELLAYLSTGLIGPRVLNWITHSRILVDPTLYGDVVDDYKKLVTEQIGPFREQALSLLLPRIHRAFRHKEIKVQVWYDADYSTSINPRSLQTTAFQKTLSWDVKLKDIRQFFPADFAGPVYLEVLALANADFVEKTFPKEKSVKGIDSAEMIVSVTIWRFLHIRGYVDDSHKLTTWGNALATSLLAVKEATEGREAPGLEEAVLFAFELIRLGQLTGKFDDNEPGTPRNGSEEDRSSLTLISRCATLLKLRHQVFGYTGPLNKSLLKFRSFTTTVREADRDLVDAIVASMLIHGQAERDRTDAVDLRQRLPFLQESDIGLGIAVCTFFDEDAPQETEDERKARLAEFPKTYVPFAEALPEDMQTSVDFVRSLNQGIQTLNSKEAHGVDKAAWSKAQAYLDARPF